MAKNSFSVTGDQYRDIDRKAREIQRQLDQKSGSPLYPPMVDAILQWIVEGGVQLCDKVNTYPTSIPETVNLSQLIEECGFTDVDATLMDVEVPVEIVGKTRRYGLRRLGYHAYIEGVAPDALRPQRPVTLAEMLLLHLAYFRQRPVDMVAFGSLVDGGYPAIEVGEDGACGLVIRYPECGGVDIGGWLLVYSE